MRPRIVNRLLNIPSKSKSWIRTIVTGALYRISDIQNDSVVTNINTQINTMRSLATDSQISTALSYYATDATTVNSAGDIIWATGVDDDKSEISKIVNKLLSRWKVNLYARDHIMELATYGNLYIPTTGLHRDNGRQHGSRYVSIGSNSIPDGDFDIIPSYNIPPEDVLHLYYEGNPFGYLIDFDESQLDVRELHPESSCIHFSLGGLLGKYTIDTQDESGNDIQYDVKFAQPLMERASQPTQTLSLLEDSLLLASLIRTIKFIHVDCGDVDDEDVVRDMLTQVKNMIESQISLNTNSGDTQSFLNPQSPNNLIYIAKTHGQNTIDITDLNMSDATEEDSKLLDYYQNKKLSVLGIPKEALNFSSNEGLGGAGSVLSQRSALYANSLQRLKTAYIEGWTDAINTYFTERGLSGYVNQFKLHMTPVVTEQSTITFERRDSAIQQASAIVQLMKDCGVKDAERYKSALTEILVEAFPTTSSYVNDWDVDLDNPDKNDAGGGLGASF